MFGTLQQSSLRIEIAASADRLRACLTQPADLQKWLKFQRFPAGLPEVFTAGSKFTSYGGYAVPIQQTVEFVETDRIRFLLAQGIDGFHDWAWGDGWVQSQIEGVSLLPIGVGQSASLLLLKQYVKRLNQKPKP
jgi:hypothetical protein